jgi:hypothetical protein
MIDWKRCLDISVSFVKAVVMSNIPCIFYRREIEDKKVMETGQAQHDEWQNGEELSKCNIHRILVMRMQ